MSKTPYSSTVPRECSSRTSVQSTSIIDLIYFAKPTGCTEIHEDYTEDKVGWYGPEDWDDMRVNTEVRGWCERALAALKSYGSEQSRR